VETDGTLLQYSFFFWFRNIWVFFLHYKLQFSDAILSFTVVIIFSKQCFSAIKLVFSLASINT